MSATVNLDLMNRLPGTRFVESACSTDTLSMYSISHCYFAGNSAFSEIVIAQNPSYGKVLFLDKELQSAESDEALYHEHLVHPVLNAMAHVPMKHVLIVGGGEGATAREVLKWSREQVALVTWVDIDQALVDLCRRHLSWADDTVYNSNRLNYFAEDIRTFLARPQGMYDIVILDLPDPDIAQLQGLRPSQNGYPLYSRAFFQAVIERMKPHGALVTHCGPIAPGGADEDNREGLHWIKTVAMESQLGSGSAYHVTIPSFQSDWGFWMSVPPSSQNNWPQGLIIMNGPNQDYAFTWPSYYTSPWF